MDEDKKSRVTINFDTGEIVRPKKYFLMNHSLYFQAMFSGNFIESHSGNEINLKGINYQGFNGILYNLKNDDVNFKNIEELLLILETSLILQFTATFEKSVNIIKERFLFTYYSTNIFSVASKFDLKELYDKARIYILYDFKMFLIQNRKSFFEFNKDDLLLLLNDSRLNIENELYVYNLIVDWCKKNDSYDDEYLMTKTCVKFNSMNKNQLLISISRTNNLDLQNYIKQFLIDTNQSIESIRPAARNVPNVLCAIRNEDQIAYIYCWDWTALKFVRFIKIESMPVDTTGYHVIVKGMDIFVMAGEIHLGRGIWNQVAWSYNLLTKQWKEILDCNPSKRRHGVGHACGNVLYLLGGLTTHRLPNLLIERFTLENGNLVNPTAYRCSNFIPNKFDRHSSCCFEYKNNLVLISKYEDPVWFQLVNLRRPPYFTWNVHKLNLKVTVITAISYLDYVYILAYNEKNTVDLLCYSPEDQTSEKLQSFKSAFNHESTICAFNVNKAMVFSNNVLEYYCLETGTMEEFSTDMGSFHSNYFFSIPIY